MSNNTHSHTAKDLFHEWFLEKINDQEVIDHVAEKKCINEFLEVSEGHLVSLDFCAIGRSENYSYMRILNMLEKMGEQGHYKIGEPKIIYDKLYKEHEEQLMEMGAIYDEQEDDEKSSGCFY